MTLLITDIGCLMTLAPLAQGHKGDVDEKSCGIIHDAFLLLKDGKVHDYGPMRSCPQSGFEKQQSLQGKLVLPGLVDSHTHPLFAGERDLEFSLRLAGASYQEIAKAGGGILSTVSATQQSSDDELRRKLQQRLARFLSYGVTTCEIKSGYGLSVTEELRHLRLLTEAKQNGPQTLRVTCLALHAIPKSFSSAKAYADEVTQHLLPQIATEGLCDFVDAFVEQGYFTADDVSEFFTAAQAQGLGIRLHADEFTDAGGGLLAARLTALSADHLQFASDASIEAMAKSGTVATLLPGTALYTSIPYADARRFLKKGVQVALATDYNPGSCVIDSLPFIATLGAIHCHMNTYEAIAAVTYFGAKALGLESSKGALDRGYDGDFLVWDTPRPSAWLADLGRTLPREVWIGGEKVL